MKLGGGGLECDVKYGDLRVNWGGKGRLEVGGVFNVFEVD